MTYIVHYAFFIFVYFIYFFPIWDKNTRDKLVMHIIMFVYLSFVFTLTIIPLPTQFHFTNSALLQSINFIPFRDIIYGYAFAKREALLNVIMMIPFGILLSLLTKKRLLAIVLATCLFSLTIETTQYFTILFQTDYPRIVDITDVITNTIGGFLGYSVLYVYKKLFQIIIKTPL